MRAPQDLTPRRPRVRIHGRWWIVVAVVAVVLFLVALFVFATLYTDSLWFSSVNLHSVWSTLLTVKIGLFACFAAIFFFLLWVNLVICDRTSTSPSNLEAEDELVRRYQRGIRPYAGRIYAVLAFVLALIAGAGTIGQWQNWILFSNGGSFGVQDPQFHKDVGFFVFKLPFYNFLVSWTLVSLVVVLVVTAVFYYLNGGIRVQRGGQRVMPAVKVHLSILLALIALVKAVGYYLVRFQLDVSTNGYVEGVGYTDAHARLPAYTLLMWVSLAAAAVLIWNIWRQGWQLPVLAVGVWAFVALVIGVIYPALLQALRVGPAQSTLELPYIQRNIAATRAAYGINNVQQVPFTATTTPTPGIATDNAATLNNIRVWDPDPQIALPAFQKLQGLRTYYTFDSTAVDRYAISGNLTPTLIGVRQLNSAGIASQTWVNTHLQYTHGEGTALAEANQTASNGSPLFGIQGVPPTSSTGLPEVTQAGIYFGLNDPGYVVANSKQAEIDYQEPNGANVTSHYSGSGGVRLSSLFTQFMFALRLKDPNLLISNLITGNSRIMFVRDIQSMAQKTAPFLSWDADPYAVIVNGHIDWVLDGYTTTSQYPYSQNASSAQVPPGSGLPASYNYVRNSVKLVIDAYSGSMTFYDMTTKSTSDPVLQAYESAFPGMFVPVAHMSSALRAQLRYPEDIFSVQTAVYGRYHITSPTAFYNAADAWSISPTAGAGPPSQALLVPQTTNAQGQIISGPPQRMAPIYQVLQEPATSGQALTISDAYVPYSSSSTQIQTLSAFMMATSDPNDYGKLKAYVTPSGQSIIGPAQADAQIEQNSSVSSQITLLDQHGSSVLLGNTLMVPLDQSMLYIRPLYVASTDNPVPQLRYVIAVFGPHVVMDTSTGAALSDLFGAQIPGASTGPSNTTPSNPALPSTISSQIQQYLKQASADYTQAQADLKAGNLGAYQQDVDNMNTALNQAQQLLSGAGAATSTGTSTTTAPPSSSSTAPQASAGSTTTTTGAGATSANPSSRATTTTVPANEALAPPSSG
jgi:uncharacterized membrane protein (UPF0182 family)